TDFKLSAGGEYLALSPPGGAPPPSEFAPAYPAQLEDVSYGSLTSGPIGFLAEPTPGAVNVDELYQARDVDFDAPRGFYEAAVTVTLSCEEEDAAIRYTTDGSEPSAVNGSDYAGALVFNETTCLRAIALQDGMAPSEVSTRSYLFVEDVLSQSHGEAIADGFPAEWIEQDGTPWTDYHDGNHPGAWYGYEAAQLSLHTEEELKEALLSLPSVSLVMSIDDWFAYKPEEGLFGVYANPHQEGDDWDRAGSFEWIDPATDDGFQINCGLGMQGGSGSTITWASQASIDAKFQRQFGPGKLRFPLFEDSPVETFDKLVFDAGNQNSIHANVSYSGRKHAQGLRDQFMMDLQSSMGRPAVRGRHANLFINGLYWGLYNVHESPDDNWASNHGVGEPEEYDWAKEGAVLSGNNHPHDHPSTPGSWRTAVEIAANGLGVDDLWQGLPSYEALAGHIDLGNYADYMLLNFYGGHLDWPQQNWNATSHARNSADFGDTNPERAFEFQSWDAETTLNWHGVTAVDDGWYDRTFVGDTNDIANISFIYGRLKSNPEFRLLMADRAQCLTSPGGALFVEPGAEAEGTPYEPGQNTPADLYYERSLHIEDAVKLEYARWANYFVGIGSVSPADWQVERTRLLEEFFPVRSDILIQQLSAANPPMYPATDAPVMSQHGGHVEPGFELELSATAGEVYVTTDGSDPRLIGGAISPAAQLYRDPIAVDGGLVTIKARALAGGEWSALTEAVFTQVLISEVMARNE
ncbi:MAG: chitobiase/beta-hexosaminidase C-terminal domain-containing protein, partial [Planctomycetes bacterium]|nr:chitobiase/beta-hexosaminidase C-terminal domain-containing protein [Planctomycetota bacterium]